MKKIFAMFAICGIMTLGLTSVAVAQEQAAAAPDSAAKEVVQDSAAAAEAAPATVGEAQVEEVGFHKMMKVKFIEGSAFFMSFVAATLVFGLAFCIERIVYLNLSDVNSEKLIKSIEDVLDKNDIQGAIAICRKTRGPIASMFLEGLLRFDQGLDTVDKAVVSAAGVQMGLLEKGFSWITLFIAMAPALGFLGTVIGMVQAFDAIQQAGDISPTVVAGGMKVALITTIFGLIVALILQLFYNYVLTKSESIVRDMESSSLIFMDYAVKFVTDSKTGK